MSSKLYPTDVLKQAQEVLSAWKNLAPPLILGDLTPEGLAADIASASPLAAEMDELEALLTDKRNQRDTLYNAIWHSIKRIRNAAKGIYGDDSSQYEMVGGTRRSERRPRPRKHLPTP